MTRDLHAENLRSGSTSVRWQAQLEDHLAAVREANTMLRKPVSTTGAENRQAWALQANANASAALALAVMLGAGDVDQALSKLADRMEA